MDPVYPATFAFFFAKLICASASLSGTVPSASMASQLSIGLCERSWRQSSPLAIRFANGEVVSGWRRRWRERIGKRHTASLVTAGGLVYFLFDEGVTRVVRPGKQFELIAENAIGEHCCASPAISRGQIFLRSEKHLFCIGEASE
jgi:hypothetical protein